MIGFASPSAFRAALGDLSQPDAGMLDAACAHQAELTKPAGSLGRLEDLAIFLAGWQRRARPRVDCARAVIFAGNHGIAVHGVSAFPPSVTAQMVANFHNGGAAINALSEAVGLELQVVALDLATPTADFTAAPAMTEAECLAALNAGAAIVENVDLLVVGEMGIGNSTAAATVCARSFAEPAADWIGPGTGIDAAGLVRKAQVVERALAFHQDAPRDAFETLRRVSGREIAAIAGAVLQARRQRVPVVLDGFISSAAVAPLATENPAITDHCIAGHCSAEPSHARLLERLGLTPLLSLGMRLGEGSGAAVAVGVIRAALAAHDRMASFAEAQVAPRL